MKQGICTNFGNCTKADDPDRAKHPIQIPDGAEFVCPECGAPLTPTGKGPVNVLLPILLIFALLVLCGIGGGAWYLLKPKPNSVAPPGRSPPQHPCARAPRRRPQSRPRPRPRRRPRLRLRPRHHPSTSPCRSTAPTPSAQSLLLPCSMGSCVRKVGPTSPAFPARTPTSIRSRALSPVRAPCSPSRLRLMVQAPHSTPLQTRRATSACRPARSSPPSRPCSLPWVT